MSPVIASVELGRLSRLHFAAILAQPPPPRWPPTCAAACRPWSAGLEEGLLRGRQDVLLGVRWAPPAGEAADDEETAVGFVDEADIPQRLARRRRHTGNSAETCLTESARVLGDSARLEAIAME